MLVIVEWKDPYNAKKTHIFILKTLNYYWREALEGNKEKQAKDAKRKREINVYYQNRKSIEEHPRSNLDSEFIALLILYYIIW